jgi:hypothetical protein
MMDNPWTVAELVDWLKNQDQSLPVYVAGCGGDWTDVLNEDAIDIGYPDADESRPSGVIFVAPLP